VDNAPESVVSLSAERFSRPTAISGLGYIGIGVSDLAAWEHFATAILGLEVYDRDDGNLRLRMDDQQYRILIQPSSADDLEFVGWEVANESVLAALEARLQTTGYASTRASAEQCRERRVAGLIRLTDPAGLKTELFWGPLVDYQRPFKSPRAITGFDTAGKGLGHIVLMVDDFEATMRFYRDVLGMRISDFIEFNRLGTTVTMAFLRCNPRHHSLAFMELPSAPKRISHVMLQALSLDDVGRTYSLCQEQNVPLTMTLGRHTNDHMVSFYVRTPSGFALEYGWGGRTIDDDTWQVQTHHSASIWGHERVLAPAQTIKS